MILTLNWGKDSIGWGLLKSQPNLELLGTGAVTFSLNSCQAAERRNHRRQRRHIRSTRQRIVGIKNLLNNLGVLTQEQLNQPGCAWPWLLAARILRGGETLSWPELWDVLRWYAHNRGYDGNRRWSYLEKKVYVEDSQKEKNAWEFMKKHNTQSMAETFCAELGLDPLKDKKASHIAFKNQNAAFPRKVVEAEVRKILNAHVGKLPKINQELIRTLLGDGIEDKKAWQAICQTAHPLPKRFEGGLLFGQLVARFDNRERKICSMTYPRRLLELQSQFGNKEKTKTLAAQASRTPNKNCPEFYQYRWATLLSRVQIKESQDSSARFLNATELQKITERVRQRGHFTATQFKKVIRSITHTDDDNVDKLLAKSESVEALLVDPIRKLETSNRLMPFWNLLPEPLKRRIRGRWRRGHAITLEQIRIQLEVFSENLSLFDRELEKQLKLAQGRRRKRERMVELKDLIQIKFYPEQLTGRAPYTRSLMRQATQEIMEGKQPYRPGGCLFLSPELQRAQSEIPLFLQTKSHWVQHRMLLLERLVKDIVQTYVNNDLSAIRKIIFKVDHPTKNFDQEISAKALKSHRASEEWEKLMRKLQLDEKIKNCKVPITSEIIRKACIAEDLGWRCPYTGEKYQPIDLVLKKVDKDYISPDLQSFSENLDSLVLTFTEIHNWKGNRSAARFIEEETGKPVPNLPHLSITSPSKFRRFVEGMEMHEEQSRDKQRMAVSERAPLSFEFSAFETSQSFSLTQIGARMISRVFRNSVPIVTLSKTWLEPFQKQWNLEGYLTELCPQLKNQKSDHSRLSYLNRALKACSQGLFSYYANQLKWPEFNGKFHSMESTFIPELPNHFKQQLIHRLVENRVVQHLPARLDGLKVEQNIWRVISRDKDDQVTLRQRHPIQKGLFKTEVLGTIKLLGLDPEKRPSKLEVLKGALIVRDNFGIAVGPQSLIVPFHKVWLRLQGLKEKWSQKRLTLLRNGQLLVVPRERQRKISRWGIKGTWRIFSVKNNRGGIALDLGYPDAVKAHMINISLEALLKAGAYPLITNLVGENLNKIKQPEPLALTA